MTDEPSWRDKREKEIREAPDSIHLLRIMATLLVMISEQITEIQDRHNS
jgi:hypothetical protein